MVSACIIKIKDKDKEEEKDQKVEFGCIYIEKDKK